ncbi:MAG: cell wall hydrolase [Lachnospiraceae bacterium]|nr:cell wall hydrolase [Lachnospiraceae bacterium]
MKNKKLWAMLLALCLSLSLDNISASAAEDVAGAAQKAEGSETVGAEAGQEENRKEPEADTNKDGAGNVTDENAEDAAAGQDGTAEKAGNEDIKKEDTEASESRKEAAAGKDAGVQENGDENTADDGPLADEAANISSVLFSSISRSLNATIMMEQSKEPAYSAEELMYLSCIIYCEAGNQSFTGKVGVANVVMNRAKSKVFDHVTNIREAIYDCERWGRQFSPVYVKANGKWTTKGSTYEKALNMYKTGKYAKDWQKTQMEECIKAAEAALEGKYVLEGDYLYFNMNISSTKSKCKKNGKPWQVIGCHIFY